MGGCVCEPFWTPMVLPQANTLGLIFGCLARQLLPISCLSQLSDIGLANPAGVNGLAHCFIPRSPLHSTLAYAS